MSTKELLAQAKEWIFLGWIKGSYVSYDGACAYGAIEVVGRSYSLEKRDKAIELLANVVAGSKPGQTLGIYHKVIVDWNDDKARTKADVLTAFDKAIEKASE